MRKSFEPTSFLHRTGTQITLLKRAKEKGYEQRGKGTTEWRFDDRGVFTRTLKRTEAYWQGEVVSGPVERITEVPQSKMPELRKKVRKTPCLGKVLLHYVPMASVGQETSTPKGSMKKDPYHEYLYRIIEKLKKQASALGIRVKELEEKLKKK